MLCLGLFLERVLGSPWLMCKEEECGRVVGQLQVLERFALRGVPRFVNT